MSNEAAAIGTADRRPVHALIVGAGLSGLGAAIRLKQHGFDDFVVVERGSDVGGTWRVNSYPGAGCDVPSQLYSYSFALNPEWSHSFSPQPEIYAYLRKVADDNGIRDRLLFDSAMTGARWNTETSRWDVDTANGNFSAQFLISGAGVLAEPSLPDIKGISTFEGKIFHSSRWDHSAELAGKRVAVIGTGSSSVQIVPSIAPEVERLDVYQRTATWVMPHLGRRYTGLERVLFKRVPGFQRFVRGLIYANREIFVVFQVKYPKLAVLLEIVGRVKMFLEIRDPEKRRKVVPTHRLGCKRMLVSNKFYRALDRKNVDLVTDGISEIRANSIVTEDGTEREVDAIVLATGFHVADSPTFNLYTGADGRTMAECAEEEGPKVYKGTTATNFPNLFMMLGANSGLNYTSLIYIIESQLNYVLSALTRMRELNLGTFEVKLAALDDYNAVIKKNMATTVWATGGCQSWFLDKAGNNSALWPDFSFRFRNQTREFDLTAYETTPAVAR
ncbi:flavin-containing monooxygenase [Nocardia camponoti]|uniref:Baeyer-Villiger monooxygenase n=1 Tax=Nocardia camponoti TaxID=1616106 RepID=A0A917V7C4_9NOCA|nr:NAD(P)/FAD-dependent oxidoreductase [Nocardia camponoti]GGK47227.1 Baeyer-Villiger monooxygenase [Nocardia camponoti]